MDTATQSDTAQTDASMPRGPKVGISRWIWRLGYARLWWLGAILYWIGFALSFYVPVLESFYSTALAGYLNVAFYPPVILMILGVGFIRAKLRRGDWVIVDGDPVLPRDRHSMGGSLNPYSNPLDPRSGSLWVGSQESISRVFGKKWP